MLGYLLQSSLTLGEALETAQRYQRLVGEGGELQLLEQEDRLQAVEKDIYTPIADRRRCEPKAIQSAVRRAAKGAWLTNPEYVQQLAGYPLTGSPSAVQFLVMLYNAAVRAV